MVVSLEGEGAAGPRCSPAHFVLLQHGSHGRPQDLNYLAGQLVERGYVRTTAVHTKKDWWPRGATVADVPLAAFVNPANTKVIFDSQANQGNRTDDGLHMCVRRLLDDLLPALTAFVTSRPVGQPVLFSAAGHSFGGILLRGLLPALRRELPVDVAARITWHQFVTVATPHLGARMIGPWLHAGGRLLGATVSQNYFELLLMAPDGGPLANELIGEEALAALEAFAQRRLYGNVHKDKLVSFETSTLIAEGSTAWFGCDVATRLPRATANMLGVESLHPTDFRLEPPATADKPLWLEWKMALALRRRMTFDVVPVVSTTRFAHSAIVSKRKLGRAFQPMNDCGQELAAYLAGEATKALPMLGGVVAATPVVARVDPVPMPITSLAEC